MPLDINQIIVPTSPMSVEHDAVAKGFKLVNDQVSPGANKVYGTDGAGVKGWKDDPSGGSGTAFDEYDSGFGFWVCATAGVVTTNPSQGNYTVTVPADGVILKMWKDFTAAGEYTVGGEVVITIDKSATTGGAPNSDVNRSRASASVPDCFFIDSGGNRRELQKNNIGQTIPTPIGGVMVMTLSNVNGLGWPALMNLGSF